MTEDKSKPIQMEDLPPRLNDGYDQPLVIDDVLYAFPGHLDKLLPPMAIIPEEFKQGTGDAKIWTSFVGTWFYKGWPTTSYLLYTRPDVEGEDAFRHASTILRSFEPKHEHKMAGVAWLLSRWFAEVVPQTEAV